MSGQCDGGWGVGMNANMFKRVSETNLLWRLLVLPCCVSNSIDQRQAKQLTVKSQRRDNVENDAYHRVRNFRRSGGSL
jgi:hypothetical protein